MSDVKHRTFVVAGSQRLAEHACMENDLNPRAKTTILCTPLMGNTGKLRGYRREETDKLLFGYFDTPQHDMNEVILSLRLIGFMRE